LRLFPSVRTSKMVRPDKEEPHLVFFILRSTLIFLCSTLYIHFIIFADKKLSDNLATITKLELLSPAKDLECGIAAINCGADAVYIGAPRFGARAAAGNSVNDIQTLAEYARKFWAKVYVTVNTIIYNNEIEEVQNLITRIYEAGADAIIFQDMAVLQMDLPPIQLFASTQTHNFDLERIKLLDQIGIKRIILARELSLDQIKEIKKSVSAELEFFVHGALCVCLSGQCYMSAAMMGRSANRGECAQPCRLEYSLLDKNGKILIKDKHLLSLRDLNLSAYLNELIEAGITSFKIEGRLKDIGYVKNITAYYRHRLDSIIESNPSLQKSSSGSSIIPFQPDPDKTFNRGYSSYFIDGKDENISSINTPKSMGKFLGEVSTLDSQSFTVDSMETIVNGDGLCFFDESGELIGMSVNNVKQNRIFTNDLKGLTKGIRIYRNYDHGFNNELKKDCTRKIKVRVSIDEIDSGLKINAVDEAGVQINYKVNTLKQAAEQKLKAIETFKKQFLKSGESIFDIEDVKTNFSMPLFFPVKIINELRRKTLKILEKERTGKQIIENRESVHRGGLKNENYLLDKTKLDYRFNVVNKLSKQFYIELGAEEIEDGFELQNDFTGMTLMACKYCIKEELGFCTLTDNEKPEEPLYLLSGNKKYKLVFNCKECMMEIKYD
jgi:23S rRNA 5-hydroxycytidine C2501 synthase